jgi:hypothetical protein
MFSVFCFLLKMDTPKENVTLQLNLGLQLTRKLGKIGRAGVLARHHHLVRGGHPTMTLNLELPKSGEKHAAS